MVRAHAPGICDDVTGSVIYDAKVLLLWAIEKKRNTHED